MPLQDEDILCVKRELLPAEFLPEAGAHMLSWQDCIAILQNAQPQWHGRNDIEGDARYKQIIPYVLVIAEATYCATYCRAGTEGRLHGLRSVGIGGHVAKYDTADGNNLQDAVFAGLRRELEEEMPGAENYEPQFLGIINEEKTNVGTVHMGLVFVINLPKTSTCTPGKELSDFSWQPLKKLLNSSTKKRYELWSQLALGLMTRAM